MPSYEAGKTEDRQRMTAKLANLVNWLKDPQVFAVPGNLRSAQDQYKEIASALGLDPDYRQLNKYISQAAQGADPYDFMPKAVDYAMNNAGPVGQPGQPPAATFGRADNANGYGQDAGGFGNGQKRAPETPYGYIINPDAYEYGGRKGLAQEEQTRYGGLANTAQQKQAEYAQQYQDALSQSGAAREQQQQGLGYLRGLAEGTGPSAAQQQMNMGLAAARNQQASIAASARGGGANLAAAQAASAQAAGQMGIQGIQAAGLARAQEQLGAIGQYGQLAGQVREGDFDVARMQASQQQAQAIQQSQWEQYRQAIMAQQSQNQQNAEQQNLAREGAIRGWEVAQQQQQQQQQAQWIAAIGGAVSGLGSLASSFQSKPKVQP